MFPAGQGRAPLAGKESALSRHRPYRDRRGDTERSLAFYRDRLGLQVAGTSENWGIEQERLSGVGGAHVRITTLRADNGPGIEFLQYLAPRDGRPIPADTRPDDLWAEQILMIAEHSGAPNERLRDPDGHVIRIVNPNEEHLP